MRAKWEAGLAVGVVIILSVAVSLASAKRELTAAELVTIADLEVQRLVGVRIESFTIYEDWQFQIVSVGEEELVRVEDPNRPVLIPVLLDEESPRENHRFRTGVERHRYWVIRYTLSRKDGGLEFWVFVDRKRGRVARTVKVEREITSPLG